MLSRKRIVAVAVAAALMIVGLVGVAAAQTDEPAPSKVTADLPVADEAQEDDPTAESLLECDFEDWEPTAEELAEINAETDALADYLRGLGHEVTISTDDMGFTYVDFESADEALFEAMDGFYQQQFADEIAGWTDEEKAEWNAGIEEWVQDLAAEGITVETDEIALGVFDIVWTEELERALMELEPAGDCFIEGEELVDA